MRLSAITLATMSALFLVAPVALAQAPINKVTPPPCSAKDPCPMPFQENGKWGVRNSKGEITVPAQYSRAQFATELYPNSIAHGLIITRQDLGGIYHRLGVVDRNGVELAPPIYTGFWEKEGIFTANSNNNICAFDATGRQIVPCDANNVIPRGEWLEVNRKGGQRSYVDYSGNPIETPSPERLAAAAPKLAPALPMAPPISTTRVRQLVNEGKWSAALREAVSGTAEDRAHALISFYDRVQLSDPEYNLSLQVLESNMGIFYDAENGTSDYREKRRLRLMQSEMAEHVRRKSLPVAPIQGSGRILTGPRTVGECHSAGGTVGVMGYCSQ